MFKDIIGQPEAKEQLEELVQGSYVEFGYVPPMLLIGPKGVGKTTFGESFVHELKDDEDLPRRCITINSSTVKSPTYFFDQVYPAMTRLKSCGILFDESHGLPKEVQTLFLSVLNSGGQSHRRVIPYKGADYEFDLSQWAFLFATTDPQGMLGALSNRLTTVALRDYDKDELGRIMAKNMDKSIKLSGGIIDEIAPTLRGNARNAVLRAGEINRFCKIRSLQSFGPADWPLLCRKACILPLGVNLNEMAILKLLGKGSKTLQTLAAATGQTPQMIRLSLEPYLIRSGLMRIGEHSIREITPLGVDVLKKTP